MKLGMGLVATMSALVLGLLVSSAKNFYDAQNAELTDMSAKIVLMDRVLAHYGPESKDARDLLRGFVINSLNRVWPQEEGQASEKPQSTDAVAFVDSIQALLPKDDTQRALKAQAVSMAIALGQTRWLMAAQQTTSVSKPLLRSPGFLAYRALHQLRSLLRHVTEPLPLLFSSGRCLCRGPSF